MKKLAQTSRATAIQLSSPGSWIFCLQVFAIILVTTWIYWPVLRGDWLWDDDTEITNNVIVRSADGWWRGWLEPGSQVGYAPVKVVVEWLQWHLWGDDTLGYHVTSLVLHMVSALLAWRIFVKLGLRLAWLGGLLFAVHPIMVESVAWISELKNTLSLPPFLLAMIFYLNFEEHRKRRDYVLSVGLFIIAMLCKPMMALFPVVILLYAWWKRGRIDRRDFKSAAAFFGISLVLGLIALHAGTGYREINQPAGDAIQTDLLSQVAVVGLTVAFYVGQTFWPATLLAIYPTWPVNPPSFIEFLPWPILGAVAYGCWRKRESWGKHALLGLGFFLIMLVPVLGLMATKYRSIIWSLDHLGYLPILGLIGLVVAGLGVLDERATYAFRVGGATLLGFLVLFLSWRSHTYAGTFVNEEKLWTYTLEGNPDAWAAHNNLGYILMERGQTTDAISQFSEALRFNPDYVEAHNNLGFALAQTGQPAEAIQHFQAAIQLHPEFAAAQYNWGSALLQLGQYSEAVAHYQASLRINPKDPIVHYDCGNALIGAGRFEEAISEYQEATRLNPNFSLAQNNLGNVLLHEGRISETIACFQEALRIDPNDVQAHDNLGVAFYNERKFDEAIDQYQEALRLRPDYAEVQDNWGSALVRLGRFAEAREHFEAALKLKPNNAVTHYDWGNALLYAGQFLAAIGQYQEAVRLNPGYANAYGNWAVALNLLGRRTEAITQLKVAIRLDPATASFSDNLAKLESVTSPGHK